MGYLVTGASGGIGRALVSELLRRSGPIHVLVQPGADAAYRFERNVRAWGNGGVPVLDRLRAVPGDLTAPDLGLDPKWLAAHRGSIEHVFHLAAGRAAGAAGSAAAVAVTEQLSAGVLHHVSTVEVAGGTTGLFTEDMFDIGQVLLTPVQRAAFEGERVVREQTRVPWRIYRPSIVIGNSRTGEFDRITGPYYFFRSLRVAAQLPRLLPVLVPRLGETNMVPVDFVVRALDHIAHHPVPGADTYHLVDPRRQSAVDALNVFADQAGAPHLLEVLPKRALDLSVGLPGAGQLLRWLGVPRDILQHSEFGCRFGCTNTTDALAGTDIKVPPLAAYAPRIWNYWLENWL
ncbi:SDR family oxidoreductase [Nocardia stercoris]|uniref:Oxidoreductase n=1 Tax=Nocardia stercoris TaxID=2483361 RepID=A0A3M2L2Z5_9NOCA|nr:SDR family oxidoreductase [Nocardia stercoris]RMI31921.1 oxidoreductase [Nocardia stercoris]